VVEINIFPLLEGKGDEKVSELIRLKSMQYHILQLFKSCINTIQFPTFLIHIGVQIIVDAGSV
jgi:ribonuclease PH